MARRTAYPTQLPLNLTRDNAAFESFYPGSNAQPLEYLTGYTKGAPVYLWGEAGSGKTHLLGAACQAAGERGVAAVYLPLGDRQGLPPEALEGMEHLAMVCIDDIHAVRGELHWELALAELVRRVQDGGGGLVVAGNAPPAGLELATPHLTSRLSAALVFRLRALEPEQQLAALRLRAGRRGFDLPEETGRWLVRHCNGSTRYVFQALEALDRASLVAKRRLTVPFVREVLKRDEAPG